MTERLELTSLATLPLADAHDLFQESGESGAAEFFREHLAASAAKSHAYFHGVAFLLSGLAASFGEPYVGVLPLFARAAADQHLLSLANCLGPIDDRPTWTFLCLHQDFLVRWQALETTFGCSPANAEHWHTMRKDVERFLGDAQPELVELARYTLEDFTLDKALWDLRAAPKTDPRKAELTAQMRIHRRRDQLSFHLATEAVRRAGLVDSYMRDDVASAVAGAWRQHGGKIVG